MFPSLTLNKQENSYPLPHLSTTHLSLRQPPSVVQEDHQTQVETAQERVDADRPVGRDFIPLSQSPQLSQLTFGRKNRRSPAGVSSSESAAIGAAARGGGGGGGDSVAATEQLSLGISSLSMAHNARRSRFSAESSNLAVVGGGAGGSTHARRLLSSGTTSVSVGNTTVVSLTKERLQRNRLMGRPSPTRGEAGRLSDDHGGGTIAPASPELLYASGRITAGRYHEMLAEMDGRRGGGSTARGNGVETTGPAARKAVEPSQIKVGGARRDEKEAHATTSVGPARHSV